MIFRVAPAAAPSVVSPEQTLAPLIADDRRASARSNSIGSGTFFRCGRVRRIGCLRSGFLRRLRTENGSEKIFSHFRGPLHKRVHRLFRGLQSHLSEREKFIFERKLLEVRLHLSERVCLPALRIRRSCLLFSHGSVPPCNALKDGISDSGYSKGSCRSISRPALPFHPDLLR